MTKSSKNYVCSDCGHEQNSMRLNCANCGSSRVVTIKFAEEMFGPDWRKKCFGKRDEAKAIPKLTNELGCLLCEAGISAKLTNTLSYEGFIMKKYKTNDINQIVQTLIEIIEPEAVYQVTIGLRELRRWLAEKYVRGVSILSNKEELVRVFNTVAEFEEIDATCVFTQDTLYVTKLSIASFLMLPCDMLSEVRGTFSGNYMDRSHDDLEYISVELTLDEKQPEAEGPFEDDSDESLEDEDFDTFHNLHGLDDGDDAQPIDPRFTDEE
jgi:DNA-directed RNA polymerase subunit RPC12/RpoP